MRKGSPRSSSTTPRCAAENHSLDQEAPIGEKGFDVLVIPFGHFKRVPENLHSHSVRSTRFDVTDMSKAWYLIWFDVGEEDMERVMKLRENATGNISYRYLLSTSIEICLFPESSTGSRTTLHHPELRFLTAQTFLQAYPTLLQQSIEAGLSTAFTGPRPAHRAVEAAVKIGRNGRHLIRIRQAPKMLDMRPKQPPPHQSLWYVYRDHLPGKSHLQRYREGSLFPPFQSSLIDTSGYYIVDQSYQGLLFHHPFRHIMENQNLYAQGFDNGNESCLFNDDLGIGPQAVGTGMQNVSSQTAVQPVSLANCGRDVGPSHPQYSNKAALGNEQTLFLDHPAANAYAHDLAGSLNQQQIQHRYNPSNPCNTILDVEFQHGLPYPGMSGFLESYEYTRASPTTLTSSFSSSIDSSIESERMASMSLDPAPLQGCVPSMGFQSNYHVSSMETQEENWVAGCPATISPKMLRINPSPTPTSSSESIQTSIPTTRSDSDLGSSAWDQHEVCSALPTKHSNYKPRKDLPTKPTKPRLMTASAPRQSRMSKGKNKAHMQPQSPEQCIEEAAPTRAQGRRIVEADDTVEMIPSTSTDAERDAKNRFLVDSKLAGMTYREIRLQGGFTEAESTLRGRFRTLTKNKEQRVRKPEWQDKDIRLLKRAVRKLAKGDKTSARVPWKQVAAYIYEHDGSYHFGNATCRKKWDELVEQEAEGI
ncbi:hypothetical protein RRF57_012344 [Xylaria bambusicola]|uniref:Myb-like domain-containing protein n=1 Tax=Xylaria bambusicola TaxID=326684 RepID=A0AAN7ZAV7_9PEZI